MTRAAKGMKLVAAVEVAAFIVTWLIVTLTNSRDNLSTLGAIPFVLLLNFLSFISLIVLVRQLMADRHRQQRDRRLYALASIGPLLVVINHILGIRFPNFPPFIDRIIVLLAVVCGILGGVLPERKTDK